MKGTVTISIEDFESLRHTESLINKLSQAIKYPDKNLLHSIIQTYNVPITVDRSPEDITIDIMKSYLQSKGLM